VSYVPTHLPILQNPLPVILARRLVVPEMQEDSIMKAERIELAALAAVAGPQHTPQEIETSAYLAEFVAVCRQVAETPPDVRHERVQAVRDMLVRPADAEAVRAAFWMRAPLAARMVAVMAAKLPKARAEDALMTFNAFERGQVYCALQKLIGELGLVQKCMNGGNSAPPGLGVADKKTVMNGAPRKGLH